MSSSESKKVIDALVQEGKTISAEITINDSEKAKELLATMYNSDEDSVIKIESWGFYNVQKALQNKMFDIRMLTEKHAEEMNQLLQKDLSEFLDD